MDALDVLEPRRERMSPFVRVVKRENRPAGNEGTSDKENVLSVFGRDEKEVDKRTWCVSCSKRTLMSSESLAGGASESRPSMSVEKFRVVLEGCSESRVQRPRDSLWFVLADGGRPVGMQIKSEERAMIYGRGPTCQERTSTSICRRVRLVERCGRRARRSGGWRARRQVAGRCPPPHPVMGARVYCHMRG